MPRLVWGFLGIIIAAGCAKPAPLVKVRPAAATTSSAPTEGAVAQSEGVPAADGTAPQVDAGNAELATKEEPAEPSGANRVELKLEGIRLFVPASWRQVKPQTNIVDAEFELPHVDGDEHDGRLTLMFSGGDPQEVVANRTAEFLHDPEHPPKVASLPIGDVEARWVDLRGEWKGPSFRRPTEPRANYRMLLVIIPFTPHSSFYAKLTGPQETIAAREAEFRAFVESAQLTPPGFE